jgi:hypothetical protein
VKRNHVENRILPELSFTAGNICAGQARNLPAFYVLTHGTVAITELLCMKNAGAQIGIDFS